MSDGSIWSTLLIFRIDARRRDVYKTPYTHFALIIKLQKLLGEEEGGRPVSLYDHPYRNAPRHFYPCLLILLKLNR